MTSPSGRPTRRRQRSVRVLAAVVLLAAAGVLVATAVASGSWFTLVVTAVASVVLGAAATRITYAELAESRLDAARDRAQLAGDYRDLTAVRSAEHHRFVAGVEARMADQDRRIDRLDLELVTARADVAAAQEELVQVLARAAAAESRSTALTAQLEEAEDRAAQAALRVVELEQEVDVLTAQWQAREVQRKHA